MWAPPRARRPLRLQVSLGDVSGGPLGDQFGTLGPLPGVALASGWEREGGKRGPLSGPCDLK